MKNNGEFTQLEGHWSGFYLHIYDSCYEVINSTISVHLFVQKMQLSPLFVWVFSGLKLILPFLCTNNAMHCGNVMHKWLSIPKVVHTLVYCCTGTPEYVTGVYSVMVQCTCYLVDILISIQWWYIVLWDMKQSIYISNILYYARIRYQIYLALIYWHLLILGTPNFGELSFAGFWKVHHRTWNSTRLQCKGYYWINQESQCWFQLYFSTNICYLCIEVHFISS